jgi:hypothetical protein
MDVDFTLPRGGGGEMDEDEGNPTYGVEVPFGQYSCFEEFLAVKGCLSRDRIWHTAHWQSIPGMWQRIEWDKVNWDLVNQYYGRIMGQEKRSLTDGVDDEEGENCRDWIEIPNGYDCPERFLAEEGIVSRKMVAGPIFWTDPRNPQAREVRVPLEDINFKLVAQFYREIAAGLGDQAADRPEKGDHGVLRKGRALLQRAVTELMGWRS